MLIMKETSKNCQKLVKGITGAVVSQVSEISTRLDSKSSKEKADLSPPDAVNKVIQEHQIDTLIKRAEKAFGLVEKQNEIDRDEKNAKPFWVVAILFFIMSLSLAINIITDCIDNKHFLNPINTTQVIVLIVLLSLATIFARPTLLKDILGLKKAIGS